LRIKTQKRRAATRGVHVEHVDRDVVGDRDGWRCGICRRKVNRSLAYPHPRSPSLDHIIPISQHGPHTYANCRIAHLNCNEARSNRGGNEQLALIG
jgi:5-methylcytosine-specific restriction endonuclease McrA